MLKIKFKKKIINSVKIKYFKSINLKDGAKGSYFKGYSKDLI